jgi:uncharacterized protein
MGATERSIGFLVDDLDAAVEELRSAGVEVDAPASNAEERYVHFVAPDGQVYELVERHAARRPIFHLSIPVHDLDEAVSFYRHELGAQIGRRTDTFADALVFDAQVTLQNDPASVSDPMPRTRHFGVTLAWPEWESVSRRFAGRPLVVEAPRISYEGEPGEQAKLMIRDPSGNLIEIKAYRHPEHVLGSVADS